jgi:hypothetical protein
MERPESSPAYLERVLKAFLDALREADAMAHASRVGTELADLLRFAADLVDIIAEGLAGREGAEVPLGEVETLRAMLRKAQALLGPGVTLH